MSFSDDLQFINSFSAKYNSTETALNELFDPLTEISTTVTNLVGTFQARTDLPESLANLINHLGNQ